MVGAAVPAPLPGGRFNTRRSTSGFAASDDVTEASCDGMAERALGVNTEAGQRANAPHRSPAETNARSTTPTIMLA